MNEPEGEIIVGILGQYASGKSTAARMLVRHLGGEDAVRFLTDRALFAGQVVSHMLEPGDIRVMSSLEEDGTRRLDSPHATVWLGQGEDLITADLDSLRFRVKGHVLSAWLDRARAELGHRIFERPADGKPVVIEAGFGPNLGRVGESRFSHTIAELFTRLEEAGVEPKQIKWMIVEACFDRRSERNERRREGIPADIFARYAADGGDLDGVHQKRLEEGGTTIKRVFNDHDDLERFRADVLAAYEEMFG